MSGVFGVRGGFDSHAFPPLWAALLALATLVAAGGSSAAEIGPAAGPAAPSGGLFAMAVDDSVFGPPPPKGVAPALAESVGVAPGDTTSHIVEVGNRRRRPRAAGPATPAFSQPRWVMFRSLVVPGWGQLHNGSWIKAAGLGGLEVMMITRLASDARALDRLQRESSDAQAAFDEPRYNAAVDAYNTRLSESINRRWLLGGIIAYALMDAYVDANFRGFKLEFEAEPPPPGEPAGPSGGKLEMRWSF